MAFTNGVYSKAEKFPKYGPQWKKRRPAGSQPAEDAAETPAPVEDTPAPAEETPVQADNTIEEKKDETAPVVAE